MEFPSKNSREICLERYFDLIYQYIVNHNLQGVIVEYALFDTEVGINNEHIVVYELRTHY